MGGDTPPPVAKHTKTEPCETGHRRRCVLPKVFVGRSRHPQGDGSEEAEGEARLAGVSGGGVRGRWAAV